MKPTDHKKKSRELRQFKPTRRPAGIFCISTVFFDASLLLLAFWVLVSSFVIQPGIIMKLPQSPFSGGTRFAGNMVISITKNGWIYFDDERISPEKLADALKEKKFQPDATLIIEADEKVESGMVVLVWNAALEAGIEHVSLATQIAALGGE